MVLSPTGYTKHYYNGGERVVSAIGEQNTSIYNTGNVASKGKSTNHLKTQQRSDLERLAKEAEIISVKFKEPNDNSAELEEEILSPAAAKGLTVNNTTDIPKVYFYHSDHLGTNNYITNGSATAVQFFVNLPFGETMVEHKSTEFENDYLFTGHELDRETNLYYAHARYLNPRLGVWLSVDPLAEKYPNASPYNYCLGNPIKLTDPTGMGPDSPPETVNVVVVDGRTTKSDNARELNLAAIKKLDPSVIIIKAVSAKDMISQMKDKVGDKKIGNLIITGHGGYDNSSIEIGSDVFRSNSDFKSLGISLNPYLDKDSNIALSACHSGGGANFENSESHMQILSKFSGANIYAPMTWGAPSENRFSNRDYFDFSVTPAAAAQIPNDYRSKDKMGSRINSIKYLDTYKMYGPKSCNRFTQFRGLYFTNTGNIRY